jgi:ComEC/Rec2-related protein
MAGNSLQNFFYNNYHLLWAISIASGMYVSGTFFDFLFSGQQKKFLEKLYFDESWYFAIALAVAIITLLVIFYESKNHYSANVFGYGNNKYFLKFYIGSVILSAVLFFTLGLFNGANLNIKKELMLLPAIYNAEKNLPVSVLVSGRISGHVKMERTGISFLLEVDSLETGNRITKDIGETVQVYLISENDPELSRDDTVLLKGVLKENKGMYQILAYGNGTKEFKPSGIEDKIYKIRQRFYNCISNIFFESLDSGSAGFSEAIILGNTSYLKKSIGESFKKSGIYHLIAISGLHISFFIAIFSYLPGRLLNFPVRTGFKAGIWVFNISLLAVIFLYDFIVGQKASVLRATLMALLTLSAKNLKRERSMKYILNLSFIFILAVFPGYFKDAGFWLSFASVFAIVYLNETVINLLDVLKIKLRRAGEKMTENPVRNLREHENVPAKTRPGFWSRLTNSMVTTSSVCIFIFPILAFLFGEIPLLSPVTNIVSIPLFHMILLILFIGAIAGLFWPGAGILIIKPSGLFINMLIKVSESYKIFDRLPGLSVLKISNFGKLYVFLYYFFFFIVFIVINKTVLKSYNLKRKDC